jgi:F-type H+-transporting ATPase subunit b
MIFLAFAENSIQLVPDASLIVHMIIIFVMVFVLNATLFKPINRILEERERRTRGQGGAAADLIEQIDQGMARYENSLREARSEGYRLLEAQRAAAMQDRQSKLELVRSEIERLVADEKQAIKSQSEEARRSIETNARTLASQIGTRILRRPV